MFVNRMPRYEILSQDAVATLDRGWRRIVSEIGVEFVLPEAVEVFAKAGQKTEGPNVLLDPDFEFYLKGPVLEPLVTGICALRGRATTEIPGDEPVRIGGVTKRSIIYNGSLVLWMIVRLYVRKFLHRRL